LHTVPVSAGWRRAFDSRPGGGRAESRLRIFALTSAVRTPVGSSIFAALRRDEAVAPTLVVQSRQDNRIPPDAAERAFNLAFTRMTVDSWTEGNGHIDPRLTTGDKQLSRCGC
jgi:hypothetical protein